MSRTIHRAAGWSGAGVLVLMAFGFVGLARFFPPPSPALSADQTTAIIIGHATTIRWGMIVTMVAAVLLGIFAVSIAVQMRRIEGRFPILSMTEFGLGMLFVLEFLYLLFFWQTATFRADRDPQLIELLNDMAWIPFVGLTGTAAVQVAAFGVAILIDRRPVPVFPRWLGYGNLWVALIFCAGTFNVFFKTGPLAWNGVLSWWLPVVVFALWLIVVTVYLRRAIETHIDEVDADKTPSVAELAATIADLQRQVGQLHSRSAPS
ncbi:hypothetical protein ORI20_07400 [Mycobacterium sp. CVI_P3]|uniref:DUF4386 domain-containing protein n=1 Tax=Mycobacterium pinniadriaticum TaxID=2994102 RepID=A0ABT3S9U8_9MYCO|nr:hypothetical protein [Mycobacterium pinniadriaticum]MCX2930093.1 hypothetical protein [Mycobacterium pinniadriaticum]MCX2936258.1 hypothetical protein [Mycobacterium pinniadriaticum]